MAELPDDVRRILALEREASPSWTPPPDMQAEVLARLKTSTAIVDANLPKPSSFSAVSAVVGGLAGALAGAGVMVALQKPVPPVVVTLPVPVAIPVEAPVAPVETPPIVERKEKRAVVDPGREWTLLDEARSAMTANDPARALGALRRHEREFPRGQLVEEREGLKVLALARSGDVEKARKAAEAFERAFPSSVMIEAVRAAVRSE